MFGYCCLVNVQEFAVVNRGWRWLKGIAVAKSPLHSVTNARPSVLVTMIGMVIFFQPLVRRRSKRCSMTTVLGDSDQ